MYEKTFVCHRRRNINPMYTIFNTVHEILDMNNIYYFQDTWRILKRDKTCKDRQTNQMYKHFTTLLENANNVLIMIVLSDSKYI